MSYDETEVWNICIISINLNHIKISTNGMQQQLYSRIIGLYVIQSTILTNLDYHIIGGHNQVENILNNSQTKQFWQSIILDIKVYNNFLSNDEIIEIYNSIEQNIQYEGTGNFFADMINYN